MPRPSSYKPPVATVIIRGKSFVVAEKGSSGLAAKLASIPPNLGTDEIKIGSNSPSGASDVRGATMEDAAKVVAEIKYLVKDWIPFGMITGLVAEPGIGKSAFALWLARTIVTGNNWFNGSTGPSKPGYVLWCPTENDMAITLDRVNKWGIPKSRLILPFADDPLRSINLANESDLNLIESLVNKYHTRAVIIDSLRGAHDGDENNSQVGQVLKSLSVIAERTHAAFIVVHHTRKLTDGEAPTSNSSRGSNAIIALMRSMLSFDIPDPESKRCRIRMLKQNLGMAPKPIGFGISDKGLEFGPAPEKPRKDTRKEDAKDWLTEILKDGKWHKAKEVIDAASDFGFSTNAIQRAREELGVLSGTPFMRIVGGRSEWRVSTGNK